MDSNSNTSVQNTNNDEYGDDYEDYGDDFTASSGKYNGNYSGGASHIGKVKGGKGRNKKETSDNNSVVFNSKHVRHQLNNLLLNSNKTKTTKTTNTTKTTKTLKKQKKK